MIDYERLASELTRVSKARSFGEMCKGLEEISATIRKARAAPPVESESFAIKSYQTETDESSGHCRIVFFADRERTKVLGHLTLDTPHTYDFAADVMHSYDTLEGI